ncbi:MAG: hypothetical protein KGL69_05070 [Alphaproteobacteria bacterium]|nr:hypothetical protein [Alphaproteobacteria bacterium]
MRLAIAALIGATSLAPLALAQTPPPATQPQPQAAAPAPMAAPAATPAAMPAAAPAPEAAPAPAPPPPPAPPTDPTAIALLDTLEKVCIPAVDGGNAGALAKTMGFRKSGDNWVYKRPGYQFTLLAAGSNPHTCQVELLHPIDQAEPAKTLIVALHNWAVFGHGWSLDRNDKHTTDGEEFITRSWVHDADGQHRALVLTTIRNAPDVPAGHNADTSELFYSATPTGR